MWSSFFLTFTAIIVFTYFPGGMLLRACNLPRLTCFAAAPLLSIPIYEILSILLPALGLRSSWITMALPFCVISIAVWMFSFFLRNRHLTCPEIGDWRILGLYLAIGCGIGLFYFVLPLNGPGSFSQGPDNGTHLSLIQAFLNSENYSMLGASYYQDITNLSQSPSGTTASGGFYPTAWHCLAALSASFANVNAPIAINASLFMFLTITIPTGTYLFLRSLTTRKSVLACGALVALAFGGFPWRLLTFGPLFPNFTSFALVPALMAVFVLAFTSKDMATRLKQLALFIFGLAALALLQTNAVFTAGTFLAPYCCALIWRTLRKRSILHAAAGVTVFLVAAIAAWLGFFYSPLLEGVVSYPWAPFGSIRQEIINILFVSYDQSPVQPLLGFFVLAGIAFCLVKKQNRWLIAAYIITCIMCMAAAVCSGFYRSLIIGFWYTDTCRIVAMASLAAIPLAAYGLSATLQLLLTAWRKATQKTGIADFPQSCCATIILAFFFAILFYPNFVFNGRGEIETALGAFEGSWYETNHNQGLSILTEEEGAFLDKVSEIVADDELVINKPDDGSVWAYAGYGIDAFYRKTSLTDYDNDTEISKLLRLKLNEYSNNKEVQEAVRQSNAQYVLLLDQGIDNPEYVNERYWFDHYAPGLWKGIDAITDQTPGFEIVLSEGDMRLYRILTTDEL